MNLIETPYEKLDENGKTIYNHYHDCIRVIQGITTSLIEEVDSCIKYLEPLMLDLSLDKEVYIKYRYILNNLGKQIKSFENKFYYEKSDVLSKLDIERTLVISNQIRSLCKKLISLITAEMPNSMTSDIESISTCLINLCDRIKYYTKQCKLDIKLHKKGEFAVQQILDNKNIFGKGKKELASRIKQKTKCRYQEIIPISIRNEIEFFYNYIKEMVYGNPSRTFGMADPEELDTHLNIFVGIYKKLEKELTNYIKELCILEIPIFLRCYDTLNKELLDCNLTKGQYDACLKLAASLDKINSNNDEFAPNKIVDTLEKLTDIIKEIIITNPELKDLKTDFTITINYELDMINKIMIALSDLKSDCKNYIGDVEFFANLNHENPDNQYTYYAKIQLQEEVEEVKEEALEEETYNDEFEQLYDQIIIRKRNNRRYDDYTDYIRAQKDEKRNNHIKTLKHVILEETYDFNEEDN